MSQRELLLRISVIDARHNLVRDLIEKALALAPAADLLGDEAPEHVLLAKAIADLLDDTVNADMEKAALRFLAAILRMPASVPWAMQGGQTGA